MGAWLYCIPLRFDFARMVYTYGHVAQSAMRRATGAFKIGSLQRYIRITLIDIKASLGIIPFPF